MDKSKSKLPLKALLLLIGLVVSAFLGIALGSVKLSVGAVVEGLFATDYTIAKAIVYDIRLPRVCMALLVGANLSASGGLLQAVMRNPLADPGITGVSAGASLMAIIILLLLPGYVAILPVAAFVGGSLTCAVVYSLAWKNGEIEPLRIVLAGVAINAILGGATGLISLLNSDKIQGVMLWTNGSMARVTMNDVWVMALYSLGGLGAALFCIRPANVLQLGDDTAISLGYNVNRTRVVLSVVAVFLAAISVAFVGLIGFVGLVVPHIVRLLFGSDYKWLLPMSMVLGGLVLVVGDTAARIVAAPIELPVGTMMAIIGGPFFLYLLRKGTRP